MALFPTSPTNGDTFVRDSIPYIYDSTDNKGTITTDADLVAGNIKETIDILGVVGTVVELPSIYSSGVVQGIPYRKIGDFYFFGTQWDGTNGYFMDATIATLNQIILELGLTTYSALSPQYLANSTGYKVRYWNGLAWSSTSTGAGSPALFAIKIV